MILVLKTVEYKRQTASGLCSESWFYPSRTARVLWGPRHGVICQIGEENGKNNFWGKMKLVNNPEKKGDAWSQFHRVRVEVSESEELPVLLSDGHIKVCILVFLVYQLHGSQEVEGKTWRKSCGISNMQQTWSKPRDLYWSKGYHPILA